RPAWPACRSRTRSPCPRSRRTRALRRQTYSIPFLLHPSVGGVLPSFFLLFRTCWMVEGRFGLGGRGALICWARESQSRDGATILGPSRPVSHGGAQGSMVRHWVDCAPEV